MKQKNKEIISLTILTIIYLISMPYHLLTMTSYSIGITIIIVSSIRKINGVRPPWNSIARIYLAVGLTINFFYYLYFRALYMQLEKAQVPM